MTKQSCRVTANAKPFNSGLDSHLILIHNYIIIENNFRISKSGHHDLYYPLLHVCESHLFFALVIIKGWRLFKGTTRTNLNSQKSMYASSPLLEYWLVGVDKKHDQRLEQPNKMLIWINSKSTTNILYRISPPYDNKSCCHSVTGRSCE